MGSFGAVDFTCSLDDVEFFEKGGGKRCMKGWASTPTVDREKESVVQSGLNLNPLLKGGWVNWDHRQHEIIGWPDVAELRNRDKDGKTEKALYTEFTLLKGTSMADHAWSLAKALKEQNAPRQLGLSIEGTKKKVSSKGVLLEADVLGIAVTPYPMNPEATAEAMVKAIVDGEEGAADRFSFTPYNVVDSAQPVVDAIALAIRKAVSTGYDVSGTGQSGGAAVRKENIGQKLVSFDPCAWQESLYPDIPEAYKSACRDMVEDAKRRNGYLTKAEAVLYVHMVTGSTLVDCLGQFGI